MERVTETILTQERAIRRLRELSDWIAGMRFEMELSKDRLWPVQRVYLTRELFDLCRAAIPYETHSGHFMLDGLQFVVASLPSINGHLDTDDIKGVAKPGPIVPGGGLGSTPAGAFGGGDLRLGVPVPDPVPQLLESILAELKLLRRNGQ